MRSRLAVHHGVQVVTVQWWTKLAEMTSANSEISSDSFSFFSSISFFSAEILEILDFISSDLTWFFSISDEVLHKASANMLWKLKRQSWLILYIKFDRAVVNVMEEVTAMEEVTVFSATAVLLL